MNSQPPPEELWNRFAAAARQEAVTPLQPETTGPPPGSFVARIVAQAMRARREFAALLWERWSWRAALAAIAVAAAAGIAAVRHHREPRLDVPAETLELPSIDPS